MTFSEFVQAYANHYGSKGEAWLQEYVVGRLKAGMSDVAAVVAERARLTEDMAMWKDEGDFAEYGFCWSKRDRLDYMLDDWNRYQSTGYKYF
jgi:hypothetical protein